MSEKVYNKRHLLEALKNAGLPYSYKALLKYERAGVIPQATRIEGMGDGPRARLYSKEDIDNIIARVKAYKS